MTPDAVSLVAKGRRSLAGASLLHAKGDHDFAASRAYYAMFYVAQALLLSRGLTFSKHSAVIAAFGREFVKSGEFGPEHYAALRTAFDQRNVSHYGYSTAFPENAAQEIIKRGEAFPSAGEACLRNRSGP
ncbi:MAG: HEPN domain-containing protein [Planctomycetes bacterium]|nr:HEPN domain-containing protein [Planctomycetota bacterium]